MKKKKKRKKKQKRPSCSCPHTASPCSLPSHPYLCPFPRFFAWLSLMPATTTPIPHRLHALIYTAANQLPGEGTRVAVAAAERLLPTSLRMISAKTLTQVCTRLFFAINAKYRAKSE